MMTLLKGAQRFAAVVVAIALQSLNDWLYVSSSGAIVSFARSNGRSLYGSVRQAREQLQALKIDFPWATWLPVLCQNPAELP